LRITDVRLYVLEDPERMARGHELVRVPGLRRVQYTHSGRSLDQPARQTFVEVLTNGGVSGRCDTRTITPDQMELLRHHAVGQSPLDRERLYQMFHYQELCRELTIPVMATERLMFDVDITAQWLIQGATDRVRGRATFGTTKVLKLAHFAELYNTNIELNSMGGLGGGSARAPGLLHREY
jgi:L-alanine-DL-glutamate epimerase-like enolase superfamily enzyme